MHAEDLLRFRVEVQNNRKTTLEDCVDVISQFAPISAEEAHHADAGLDQNSFSDYMFSILFNCVLDPDMLAMKQDMTLPLTYYFCVSSHNTYLTGH